MTHITISTATACVEVRETPSGVYSATNDQGRGLTGHNFFTLEEAAEVGLKLILASAAVMA